MIHKGLFLYKEGDFLSLIHIYQSSPTVALKDGTLVSEGDLTSPITTSLDASLNQESSSIKLAIRCQDGYQTQGNTIISPQSTTASKWALSLNGTTWQPYSSSITVASVINNTNTIFYAKVKATADELPKNDLSVKLNASYALVAV